MAKIYDFSNSEFLDFGSERDNKPWQRDYSHLLLNNTLSQEPQEPIWAKILHDVEERKKRDEESNRLRAILDNLHQENQVETVRLNSFIKPVLPIPLLSNDLPSYCHFDKPKKQINILPFLTDTINPGLIPPEPQIHISYHNPFVNSSPEPRINYVPTIERKTNNHQNSLRINIQTSNQNITRTKSRIDILLERQKQFSSSNNRQNGVAPKTKETKKIDISKIKIDLTGKLSLTDTILRSIDGKEDIFIYSTNKLYTLGSEGDGEGYFLNYRGRSFKLEESENLLGLEQDYLERNKENIKKFQTDNLKNLSKQYDDLSQKFSYLKDALNNEFSIEEFISDYIFAVHNKKKISKSSKYEDIELPKENLSEKVSIEDISFSGMKNSVLEKLVDEFSKEKKTGGIIMLCGNVYGVPPLGIVSGSLKKRREIALNDSFYLDSIKNFEKAYKEKIAEEIKEKVKLSFSSEIFRINEREEKIEKLKTKARKPVEKTRGDIGFDKKSDNEYIIFRDLPKYILKKNNEYYLFPEVRIGTRIITEGEEISFNVAGRVETPEYNHPFVFSGGSICYGDSSGRQKEIIGIKKTKYKLRNLTYEDKKRFAVDILRVLDFTAGVLEEGHKKNTHPVKELDQFSQSKLTINEVRSYRSQGIRVYDNDRSTI